MSAITIHERARRAWPFLPTTARAGAVIVGPCGDTVRVLPCGCVEELLRNPRAWSVSAAHLCAPRRAA